MKTANLGKFPVRMAGAAAIAMLLLSGCGKGGEKAAVQPAAVPATTASPEVMKIYEHTCRNCHAIPASGAPQTGDGKAWAARIAQGRDVLLDHSINGFKAMPPMGTCTQCTEQDFTSLIEYMSGASLN